MLKLLIKHPELAGWVIGILLTVISVLFGLVVFYFKDLIKKAGNHSGAISKVRSEFIEFKNAHADSVNSIYSTQQGIWEEIHKLHGAVVEGNLVAGRRKAEVDKLRENQWRLQRKLEQHHKLHLQFFASIRARKNETTVLHTEVVALKKGLLLIKDKKDD